MVRGAHRHSDQVARYGGEEFAILLPATDAKGAQQVALAVQSELTRAQVPHQASLVNSHVTLSIGICTLRPDSSQHNHDVLIHGADEALYTAKLRGRNRAVVNSADGLVSIAPQHCYYSGPPEVTAKHSDSTSGASASLLEMLTVADDALESALPLEEMSCRAAKGDRL